MSPAVRAGHRHPLRDVLLYSTTDTAELFLGLLGVLWGISLAATPAGAGWADVVSPITALAPARAWGGATVALGLTQWLAWLRGPVVGRRCVAVAHVALWGTVAGLIGRSTGQWAPPVAMSATVVVLAGWVYVRLNRVRPCRWDRKARREREAPCL